MLRTWIHLKGDIFSIFWFFAVVNSYILAKYCSIKPYINSKLIYSALRWCKYLNSGKRTLKTLKVFYIITYYFILVHFSFIELHSIFKLLVRRTSSHQIKSSSLKSVSFQSRCQTQEQLLAHSEPFSVSALMLYRACLL